MSGDKMSDKACFELQNVVNPKPWGAPRRCCTMGGWVRVGGGGAAGTSWPWVKGVSAELPGTADQRCHADMALMIAHRCPTAHPTHS
jgi:hypothetical protein